MPIRWPPALAAMLQRAIAMSGPGIKRSRSSVLTGRQESGSGTPQADYLAFGRADLAGLAFFGIAMDIEPPPFLPLPIAIAPLPAPLLADLPYTGISDDCLSFPGNLQQIALHHGHPNPERPLAGDTTG